MTVGEREENKAQQDFGPWLRLFTEIRGDKNERKIYAHQRNGGLYRTGFH
jgi:hypothetical protein